MDLWQWGGPGEPLQGTEGEVTRWKEEWEGQCPEGKQGQRKG